MKRVERTAMSVILGLILVVSLLTGGRSHGQGVPRRVLEGVSLGGASAIDDEAESTDVDGDFFTENLEPFGTWIDVAEYGRCWRPVGLSEGWRPYTEGYWAYTDVGWTWVSYEPFGAIVFHYGRWIRLVDGIWAWVPGREWGPAWVSWRYGDEYVGWAPLPPSARWRSEVGISTWVDMSAGIGPGHYQFCTVRNFGAPLLSRVIVTAASNALFVQITQNVTNITFHNQRPFCGGPRYDWLAARCHNPLPRLRLVCEERIDRIRERAYLDGKRDGFNAGLVAGRQGDVLVMPAPRTVNIGSAASDGNPPVRRVGATAVDSGWRGISDKERRQVEAAMSRDAAGLTPAVAPARKPGIEELKSAPKPVGVLEKREVLSQGGLKPVSEPRPGALLEGVDVKSERLGRSRSEEQKNPGVAGNLRPTQERSGTGVPLGREGDSFTGSGRLSGSPTGQLRTESNPSVNRPVSEGTLSAELGAFGAPPRRVDSARTDAPPSGTPALGIVSPAVVAPTRAASAGIKDQNLRAEEMNRNANQFAREKSAAFSSPTNAIRKPPTDPSNSGSPNGGNRPSQMVFERQRLEQQRMVADQANRERMMRSQTALDGVAPQRFGQPSQPLRPLPDNVRPPQPSGPQPVAGGTPFKPTPAAPTTGSSAKKKEEELKK